jgi:hypothetical protein
LTIDALEDQPVGTPPIAVEVHTRSTGPVVLRSTTPAVCTAGPLIEPNPPENVLGKAQRSLIAALTLLGEGRCALVAEQQQDADFEIATATGELRVTGATLFRDGFE